MNVPFWIARRYFFSRQKRSFINLISIVSMFSVGVGTMALIVVLSVFNGMEELNRQIFKSFEPDLTIAPASGKRMVVSPELLQTVRKTADVQFVTQVITDNALARYRDGQVVVQVKGVDSTYLQRGQLDTALVEGTLRLQQGNVQFANVAEGIRNALLISPQDILSPLELWYPQNTGRTINLLSENAFNQELFSVSGVFFIEQNYDNYVIIPLEAMRRLVGYRSDQLSSLEIQTRPDTDVPALKQALQQRLGTSVRVLDRDDLNPDLYRTIRIEKLLVTLTLSFLVLIASVNIFFALSMLLLEKKADIRILRAMGATPDLIRRIFLTEGGIIALSGAIVGLILGVGLCWLQDRYGLVSMGMQSALVDAYPVKLVLNDVLVTAVLVVAVTFLMSWIPAQRAARTETIRE